ncbi:L-2-amino-thiazoline-4-carboxylic acid hydrolase [Treponema sp. OMZ 840]|uniref:L-2-amino-thiazoline-4-carboxylic acid hydrolase n=1 Tax=Treponema sp. OMZ 840 TaxID=244313 RepID=UPI003D930BAE
MSKIVNNPDAVSPEAQVNRSQIEHRATWMGLIYDELQKAGVPNAEEIMRKAIMRCGEIHGGRLLARCKDADDVAEFEKVFLNDVGKASFHMNNIQASKDKLHISFNYCALCSAWQQLGFDDKTCEKLCDMAMDGDRGIAKAMGLKLDLNDTIAKGCKTCELVFHK